MGIVESPKRVGMPAENFNNFISEFWHLYFLDFYDIIMITAEKANS